MLAGVRATDGLRIGFFDADLKGLTPAHLHQLLHVSDLGYDMVCGLRDYGTLGNALQLVTPTITGERIVKRSLLAAISPTCWNGYAIETAMNETARRIGARTAHVILENVGIRKKWEKTSLLDGVARHAKMYAQIFSTTCALRGSHGRSCN